MRLRFLLRQTINYQMISVLKNIVILITCVTKDDDDIFYSQIFLEETLLA